jgi:hypothetical protein
MILVALAATLRTHDGPPTILLAPGSVQHTVVKPSATPDVLTTTT